MRLLRLLPVIGVLALSACATPTLQQRKVLDSMIGKSDVDVVRAFGVPSRSFEAGGRVFLAYIDNQTDYIPGSGGWGWGFGGGPWAGGWGGMYVPPTAYNVSCQTTFELLKGRVVDWTMRGDGC
ncbi:MAG: hypothetical protein AAYR33_10835 [Acetobacteraceae bacterium]